MFRICNSSPSLNDNKDIVLNVGDVYRNKVDIIACFSIENLVDEEIVLDLHSTLPECRFQLYNENLRGISVSDNSVFQRSSFNQWFNTVETIESVELAARTTRRIFVCFRVPPNNNETEDDDDSHDSDVDAAEPNFSMLRSNDFDSLESHALASFIEKITIKQQPKGDVYDVSELIALTKTINVTGRACQSVMTTDVKSFVSFGECEPGQRIIRDITLRNLSEIPLVFSVDFGIVASLISLENYDSGETISNGIIKGHTRQALRLIFKPTEFGAFLGTILLQNDNDSRNNVVIELVGDVLDSSKQVLKIEPSVLDFGKCFALSQQSTEISISNISNETLSVRLEAGTNELSFSLLPSKTLTIAESPTALHHYKAATSWREKHPNLPWFDVAPTMSQRGAVSFTMTPLSQVILLVSFHPRMERMASQMIANFNLTKNTETTAIIDSSVIAKEIPFKNSLYSVSRSLRIGCKAISHDGSVFISSRTISCKADVCSSVVVCQQNLINMGDCSLGRLYYGSLLLTNVSDRATQLRVQYESQSILFKNDLIDIPAHKSVTAKFTFVPRQINPHYHNELTLINLNNEINEIVIEIVANNVDSEDVALHSQFYQLNTPHSRNFVDFDNMVVNSPSIRTFSVTNVHSGRLSLNFSSNKPDEVSLYTLNPYARVKSLPSHVWTGNNDSTKSSIRRTTTAIDANWMEESPSPFDSLSLWSSADNDTIATDSSLDALLLHSTSSGVAKETANFTAPNGDLLLLRPNTAETGRLNSAMLRSSSTDTLPRVTSSESLSEDVSSGGNQTFSTQSVDRESTIRTSLLQLCASFEPESVKLPALSNASVEAALATKIVHRLEKFASAVADGLLLPVSKLPLNVNQEEVIVVVWRPQDSDQSTDGVLRKWEAAVNINIISSPQQHVALPSAPRTLVLTGKACRSLLGITQRHINLGTVPLHTATSSAKTIVLGNQSAVPLVYRIAESGTIASRAIDIGRDLRLGVVLPYRSKEIHFAFRPALTGPYSEQLIVQNILDRSNDIKLRIKAYVLKPRYFFLQTLTLPFGICELGFGNSSENTPKIRLSLTNMARARSYLIELVPQQLDGHVLALDFVAEKPKPANSDSQKLEDELDNVIRKLKIAHNKGKEDKIPKLEQRIVELKKELANHPTDTQSSELKSKNRNALIVQVPPNAIVNIDVCLVSFTTTSVEKLRARLPLSCTAVIRVSDVKNVDASKTVGVSLTYDRLARNPVPFDVDRHVEMDLHQRAVSPNNFSGSLSPRDLSGKNSPFASVALEVMKKVSSVEDNLFSFASRNSTASASNTSISSLDEETIRRDTSVVVLNNEKVTATEPSGMLLKFPTFNDRLDDVDFGTCYVDPQKGTATPSTIPFDLVNCDSKRRTLLVSVTSNLSKQVFVYADQSLENPVEDLSITAGQTLRLFAIVRATVPREMLHGGPARRLVGGLRVIVSFNDEDSVVYLRRYKVRFVALVGASIVHIQPSSLRHCANAGEIVRGSFRVVHGTSLLQAQIELSGAGNIRIVDPPKDYKYEENEKGSFTPHGDHSGGTGLLGGRETNQQSTRIFYEVGPLKPGWISERLCVSNSYSSRRVFTTISVMVHDPSLFVSVSEHLDGVPLLILPPLTVCPSTLVAKQPFRLAERLRAAFSSFVVTNSSDRAIRLVPLSNINLIVVFGAKRDLDDSEKSIQASYAVASEKAIHVVGHPFDLEKGESIDVLVSNPVPTRLRMPKIARLRRGQAANYRGQLVLRQIALDEQENQPTGKEYNSHCCLIRGSFYASVVELKPRAVDVGVLGYETQWRPVVVTMRLRNASGVPFRGLFEAPHCVSFSALSVMQIANIDDTGISLKLTKNVSPQLLADLEDDVDVHGRDVWIAARREVDLRLVIHADRLLLQPGPFTFTIQLKNFDNSENTTTCILSGVLTAPTLRLSGLDIPSGQKEKSTLTVQSFGVPLSSTTAPSYVWFDVLNVSSKTVQISFRSKIADSLRRNIDFELVSEETNMHLKTISLLSNATIVVGVRVKSGISQLKRELSTGTLLGCLIIQPTIVMDDEIESDVLENILEEKTDEIERNTIKILNLRPIEVDVRGSAHLLPTFSLNASVVVLNASPSATGSVRISCNEGLSKVNFRVQIVGSKANAIIVEPLFATVSARNPQNITIRHDPNFIAPESASDDDLIIIFKDIDWTWCTHQVRVKLTSETNSLETIELKPNLDELTIRTEKSVPLLTRSFSPIELNNVEKTIEIYGCASTDCLSSIEFGQHVIGSTTQLTIKLKTRSIVPIKYRLIVPETDNSWLSCTPNEGELTVNDDVAVIVRAIADIPATRGTYIVLENCSRIGNSTLLRVTMQSLTRDKDLFQISVGGREGSTIDFGDVFFNSQTHNVRFISIKNLSSQSLPFQLSTRLLGDWHDRTNATEIRFSISPATKDCVQHVVVAAQSEQKIYISFYPTLRENSAEFEQKSTEIDILAEVLITCRVVRHDLNRILLKARCFASEIRLSRNRLLFAASNFLQSDVWHSLSSDYAPTTVVSDEKSASSVAVIDSIDDLKQHLNIAVESTQNDKKSSFVVRNRTLFFDVSSESNDEYGNARGKCNGSLKISLRLDQLLAHKHSLSNESEIVEQLVVYNARQPAEKHTITLTLRLTVPTAFRSSFPAQRNLYTFLSLELCVTKFLKFVQEFLEGHWNSAGGNSIDPLQEDQLVKTTEKCIQLCVGDPLSNALYVELCCLTDEFVRLGSTVHVGYVGVVTLAATLFRTLFANIPFVVFANFDYLKSDFVKKWVGQLKYFLAFSPYLRGDFSALEQLSLKYHQHEPSNADDNNVPK